MLEPTGNPTPSPTGEAPQTQDLAPIPAPLWTTATPAATDPSSASPDPDASFSQNFRRRDYLRVGIVTVAAASLIIGAAVAFAASPAPSGSTTNPGSGTTGDQNPGLSMPGFGFGGGRGPGGPRGMGDNGGDHGRGGPGRGPITVASISGSNLSLKTDDGWTRTIAVTSTTTLTKGGATIAIGDIKTGDTIHFAETKNTDGTYAITAVEVIVPRVAGTVASVSDSGFTLTSRDGATWTVTTSTSTVYKVGTATGSKSDVTVGDIVVVAGTQGTNTMAATSVAIRPAVIAGTVASKTADSITITKRDGTTATIHVASSTTYRVAGVTTASLSDVTVGMLLGAEGSARSDGSIDASAVMAGAVPTGGFGHGFGFGPGGPGHDDGTAPNATSAPSTGTNNG